MLSAESMAEIEDLEELTADTGLLTGNNRLNQVSGELQRIGQRSQARAHQGDRLGRSVARIQSETARHMCPRVCQPVIHTCSLSDQCSSASGLTPFNGMPDLSASICKLAPSGCSICNLLSS